MFTLIVCDYRFSDLSWGGTLEFPSFRFSNSNLETDLYSLFVSGLLGGSIFLDCNRSLFFLYIGNFVQFKLAGFRETAFVYAIISAGMAQAIATSCRMGKLASCGCDETIIGEGRGWIWGGCSDNAIYASKFAGRFMDSREKSRDIKSQMNLHNNQAGRLVSELLVMIWHW